MELNNILRSKQADNDRAQAADDMAVLAARHDNDERVRKLRGELADRRFLAQATREVWQ